MGQLRILDKELGDLKLIWDSNNKEEVDAAKEQFDKLVGKKTTIGGKKYKYAAFEVSKEGEKSKKVTSFSPRAEMIIIAPEVESG